MLLRTLLAVALLTAGAAFAETAPGFEDVAIAGRPRPAPAKPTAAASPYLQIRLQTGADPYRSKPFEAEELARLSPQFRQRLQLLETDPAIQAVARRAATLWPDRVVPATIVLSTTERGAHFNHSFIVVPATYLNPMPGQQAPSARDVERRTEALRNTVVHELGHLLQFRLYGSWLPSVDYRSRELSNSDDPGHWYDKEISTESAWCEGFADALAAFLTREERIESFRARKVIFYGIRNPRELGRLARIEGHVAGMLCDFWGAKGREALLDRTLEVIRLSDHARSKEEHHSTFDAYLAEHLSKFPDDLLRWELVVRANTLLRDSVRYRGITRLASTEAMLAAIEDGLQALAARYGVDRTSQGIAAALVDAAPLPANAQGALAAIRAKVERLAASGQPVFEVADSNREDYEKMPLPELERAVADAHAEMESWFRHYGYDFHPKVKEAKERHGKLKAILERRRR